MKKIVSILLSFLSIICLAFAFGGCGDNNKNMDEAQIIELIKEKYLEFYLIEKRPDATVDDITVDKYYGKFGDSYVAMIDVSGYGYADVLTQETIKGLVFTYSNSNSALVLNGSQFYTLKEAYSNSILTMAQLKKLHKQFPKADGSAHELNGEPIE